MHGEIPLLPSVPNFRDLGGYQTVCGRTVRHGVVYRSQDLSEISDDDIATLQKLGIRLLCDLRSDSECRQNVNRWPLGGDVVQLNLNISADLRASHEAITLLLSGTPTETDARQALLVTYRMFPAAFAPRLNHLFECLLAGELPLIIHCAAGKDRTGFIAAVLLSALGVTRESILMDYLLTTERWRGERSEAAIYRYLTPLCEDTPSIEVVRTLCGVGADYLDAAFSVIDRAYGGLDSYLELVGLNATARQYLQEIMLHRPT